MSHTFNLTFQLGELKLGVGERNSLLRVLQQQLVCQEVNNRLLEVELQRRHMEVSYLRDARWSGVMRRTKTFGGTDFIQRGVGVHIPKPLINHLTVCYKKCTVKPLI